MSQLFCLDVNLGLLRLKDQDTGEERNHLRNAKEEFWNTSDYHPGGMGRGEEAWKEDTIE